MKKAETVYPVYFLLGAEDFLIEEEINRLMDQILSPAERGLNLHVFDGEDEEGQEILRTAQTLPMFSKYRLVLVRKADQMKEEEVEGFVNYLQNPSPTTCLVLRGQDAGPWKKHLAKIEKIGKVVEYSRLRGRSLSAWIKKRMEERGKTLSDDAANYLLEVTGDHLQDLENALERISLGAGEGKTIRLEDIEGVVSDVRVSTVFELTDAIGQQNLEKALNILGKVLDSKALVFRKDEEGSKYDDPIPLLLGMMARQYRLIWRVKEMAGRGNSADEIAKGLRMSVWNVKKLLDQAKNFAEPSLREGLLKCQKTDLALKKGRGPRELLMEKLVIDLCRPRNTVRK